jgi:hypothetical protein
VSTPEQDQLLKDHVQRVMESLEDDWHYYTDDGEIAKEIVLTAMIGFIRHKADEMGIPVDNLKTAIETAGV